MAGESYGRSGGVIVVGVPFWLSPLERMSAEAIELMCDADRREDCGETMIVRMADA